MKYVLSRHHQVTTAGALHIVYNGLTPRPLRGNKSVVQLLASFERPTDPQSLVAVNAAAERIVQTLVDKRLLVSPDTDEEAEWLARVAGGSHRRPPRQAVVNMEGLGAAKLRQALSALERVVQESEGPFSLIYRGLSTPRAWAALTKFLETASTDFKKFDWLQHFVVTDGAHLTTNVLSGLKGYNLAFRLEGASEVRKLMARLEAHSHRALVTVPLDVNTGAAELISLGAKALYLHPTEALLRELPTEVICERLQLLKKELRAHQISAFGTWDHVIFGYSKSRLPRPLWAEVTVGRDGIRVGTEPAFKLGKGASGQVFEATRRVPLPKMKGHCAGCPVVGLCWGQASSTEEGAGPGSAQCRLITAQWNEYLISTSFGPPQQVAASAAFA